MSRKAKTVLEYILHLIFLIDKLVAVVDISEKII